MRPLVAAKYSREAPELPHGGFGAYSLDYMNQTGQNFIHHGILPDEGGWNDQDAEWCDALMNWLGYWEYLDWEVKPDDERGKPHAHEENILDFLRQSGDGAPNWQHMVGE